MIHVQCRCIYGVLIHVQVWGIETKTVSRLICAKHAAQCFHAVLYKDPTVVSLYWIEKLEWFSSEWSFFLRELKKEFPLFSKTIPLFYFWSIPFLLNQGTVRFFLIKEHSIFLNQVFPNP